MSTIRPNVQGGHGKARQGKGFSLAELTEAGLTIQAARARSIAVDARRKTCHAGNVEKLRALAS